MTMQSSLSNAASKTTSLFISLLFAATAIFVLLLLALHFGWVALAGLIFMVTGLATSGLCFFADTIKSLFGKGRAVGLGIVSLYLNLMSTLTFAAPDFFAGLGVNGWIALTTIFFTATAGGSLALISFEKASKWVSVLVILFTGFGLMSGHVFARGVQYLAGNVANALGRSAYSVGAKLEDSAGDIRVKYQAEYQTKKAALEKEWENGKMVAAAYEEKRRVLDKEYERALSQQSTVVQAAPQTGATPPPALGQKEQPVQRFVKHRIEIRIADADDLGRCYLNERLIKEVKWGDPDGNHHIGYGEWLDITDQIRQGYPNKIRFTLWNKWVEGGWNCLFQIREDGNIIYDKHVGREKDPSEGIKFDEVYTYNAR